MYKLLHIHTDTKFLIDSKRYIQSDFYNFIFFLGLATEKTIKSLDDLNIQYQIIEQNEDSVDIISEKAKEFDGVILYDLCSYKTALLDKLPTVKIFLRLFGYELYNKMPNKFISKKTLKYTYPITLEKYSLKKYWLKIIKRLLNREFLFNKRLQESIYKKIDAIILINQYEYNELNNYFYLPKFIQYNISKNAEVRLSKKKNKIIIGNSKHFWNNHLDIISILKTIKKTDIEYLFFFNYGSEKEYTQKVREEVVKVNNYTLIEEFLSTEDFNKTYENAAAVVINSYRQHAIANIFTGIMFGCKIYLNPKNSTYQWLIEEGFKIDEINNLKKDIIENNIYLFENEQLHNINCYQNLQKKHTVSDFLNNVKLVLE